METIQGAMRHLPPWYRKAGRGGSTSTLSPLLWPPLPANQRRTLRRHRTQAGEVFLTGEVDLELLAYLGEPGQRFPHRGAASPPTGSYRGDDRADRFLDELGVQGETRGLGLGGHQGLASTFWHETMWRQSFVGTADRLA